MQGWQHVWTDSKHGSTLGAGLIALHDMSQRLHEDHDNAQLLANGIAKLPQVRGLYCPQCLFYLSGAQ